MMSEEISGVQTFPNLARRISSEGPPPKYAAILLPEAQAIFEEVNATIRAELVAAGFPAKLDHEKRPEQGPFEMYHDLEHIRLSNGSFPEVPTTLVAFYNGWTFERAWYYYRAKGDGIPPDIAEEFHQTWGRQVRVEGHCGCPSPLEYCHGFAIGSYHIDTPAGLKAFTELLDRIYIPSKKA
jgi:hypothetical protein